MEQTRDAAVANASQSAEERKTDQRSSTITTVEERDEGFIDNSVYYAYAKAGGLGIAAVVVTLMSISQVRQSIPFLLRNGDSDLFLFAK